MGIVGTEALFPVGVDRLRPSEVAVRVGPPFRASRLMRGAGRDRRLAMDTIGLALAALLPREYRGEYGDGAADLGSATRLLRALYDA